MIRKLELIFNLNVMKCKLKYIVSIVILVLLIRTEGTAKVYLPKLVSNGMVLQRDTPVKIWGWANAGEKVTVNFRNQNFETKASGNGNWIITIPNQKAGGPYEMVITGENQIVLKNILFGDVWLCSGQSNMQLPMERVEVLYGNDIAESDNPSIRLFTVPVQWNYNLKENDLSGGSWEAASPFNVPKFSAVAYFFARYLYAKYKVPLGIILSAAGGSCAEGWISEEALKAFPEQYQIALQLSDSSYMKHLLSTEKIALDNWFAELQASDLGCRQLPWYSPDNNADLWSDFNLPSSFSAANLNFENGAIWFRKTIQLPENCEGKKALLELGRIVDSDSVFVNGQFIGNTSYQYPPRRYTIAPGVLKGGQNNITIKVISQSGKGAFIEDKPYELKIDDQFFDLKGTWKYKIGAQLGKCPSSTYFPGQALGLYNAMLYPLINYTLKGMVWYQGESNIGRAHEYKTVFSTLITEWRELWGQGNLPFLFVQLPDFLEPCVEPVESAWAKLRDQQLKTLEVPNTTMVVTLGLGEWNDIHPLRKKEIGQRLASAAMKIAYGDSSILASGPMYQSMTKNGNKIELSFTNCGSGLVSNNGKQLGHFAIAGSDGKFVWAKAFIEKDKVIVWNENISNPVVVRYAWANNPSDANLYNKEGWPASPFSTE